MAKRTQTAHMVEAKAYPDEFASDAVEGTIHAIGDQVPPVQVASLTANNRIGKVKLNWKGGTENDLERYRIYIGTTPGFSTASAATDTADTTNYDHSTENYATTYAYKVQPVDYSGNRGPLSDEVTGIPQQSGSYDLSASSVTRNQLVNGEVIRDKIAASAVSSTKIVDGAVGEGKLAANAVTANKIDANAVTSVKIAASAITSNKITAGAVDTLQLAASAVTANKINVAQLSAINADMGTVNAGRASFDGGNVEVGNSVLSGGGDGIYVASGGGIEVADADGATVFDSNSKFQGGFKRIAYVEDTNSGTALSESINVGTYDIYEIWYVIGSIDSDYYLNFRINNISTSDYIHQFEGAGDQTAAQVTVNRSYHGNTYDVLRGKVRVEQTADTGGDRGYPSYFWWGGEQANDAKGEGFLNSSADVSSFQLWDNEYVTAKIAVYAKNVDF